MLAGRGRDLMSRLRAWICGLEAAQQNHRAGRFFHAGRGFKGHGELVKVFSLAEDRHTKSGLALIVDAENSRGNRFSAGDSP